MAQRSALIDKNGHPETSKTLKDLDSSAQSLQSDSMDFSKYRPDFPVLSQEMHGKPLAFLDTAASAQKPQAVIDAMNVVLEGGYSNIHRGLYKISQNLTEDFEAVRSKIARFIGAESEKNIIFTRNTTEGINLVAQSWARNTLQKDDEIIISEMEHHANIVPWQILAEQIGIIVHVLPVTDAGELDLEQFSALLSDKTKLVSIVQISNSLGTVNPVQDIIKQTRAFNADIKILIDGSQAVVHEVVDVQDLDSDFYVFTGHKLYAPSGIGVLCGKYDLLQSMPPYQGGGDMIERVSFDGTEYRDAPYKFEAGTPAIVEVIGLGAAIDYLSGIGLANIKAHEQEIYAYAMGKLADLDFITYYGQAADKAPVISFTLDQSKVQAHISDVGMVLDQCGVAVRTGHHCCMPLMQRYGIDGTVRASIGLYTNKDDIDALYNGLVKVQELF